MQKQDVHFLRILRPTVCNGQVADAGELVITDAAQAALLIGMGKAENFSGVFAPPDADAAELTVSVETVTEPEEAQPEPAAPAIETAAFPPVIETTAAPVQRERKAKPAVK